MEAVSTPEIHVYCFSDTEGTMWSILDYIFKRKPVPTILKQYNSINYYNGPEIATAEIRKRLLQSRGGCVDVVKNEDTGIATLCLNNPERRNAISGKYNMISILP